MQTEFAAAHLRCPSCRRDRMLRLTAGESDEREVRQGELRCVACGAEYPVRRGVGELLLSAPHHVEREAAGLERFAELMRADGWTRERIRQLPEIDDGYWYVQSASIKQLFDAVSFAPGQWLLDLGSNTCWASNYFAVRGLRVVALDISLWELQGLYTADYFIEDSTSYFERVLGSMTDIPIASASLDYVFACEVLHHNDGNGLRRTFEEAYRVLKPGAKMLVVNETLKTARDPVGVHTEAVAQFEGYEHAHWAAQYRWEAIRAGFSTRLLEPSYVAFFDPARSARKPPMRYERARLQYELRTSRLVRKAFLWWINNVTGGAAFGMIATKPARPNPVSYARALTDPRRRAVRSG